MTRPETQPANDGGGESRKRKLPEDNITPRPAKHKKSISSLQMTAGEQMARTTLDRLFRSEQANVSDADLDTVLAYAYDEWLMRSALSIAEKRLSSWTDDMSREHRNDARGTSILGQLKRRWAERHISFFVEKLEEDLDLSSQHLSLVMPGRMGGYKIELNVTPVFEIEDSNSDSSEGEDEEAGDDGYEADAEADKQDNTLAQQATNTSYETASRTPAVPLQPDRVICGDQCHPPQYCDCRLLDPEARSQSRGEAHLVKFKERGWSHAALMFQLPKQPKHFQGSLTLAAANAIGSQGLGAQGEHHGLLVKSHCIKNSKLLLT